VRTGFEPFDQNARPFVSAQAELSMVRERPDIPLHTNASGNDLRACVANRKIRQHHEQQGQTGT